MLAHKAYLVGEFYQLRVPFQDDSSLFHVDLMSYSTTYKLRDFELITL